MDGFEAISNEKVLKMLDVSTMQCSRCNGPARVPEDVLAIVGKAPDKPEFVLVICQQCVKQITEEDEDE